MQICNLEGIYPQNTSGRLMLAFGALLEGVVNPWITFSLPLNVHKAKV